MGYEISQCVELVARFDAPFGVSIGIRELSDPARPPSAVVVVVAPLNLNVAL